MRFKDVIEELTKTYNKEQVLTEISKEIEAYKKSGSRQNEFEMYTLFLVYCRILGNEVLGKQYLDNQIDDLDKLYKAIKTPANKN